MNIGAIEDVGYLSENTDVLDSLRAMGMYIMKEPELLDCIELMLKRSDPPPPGPRPAADDPCFSYVRSSQIAIGMRSRLPIKAPQNRTIWRKDPRMLVYRNLEAAEADSNTLSLGSAATSSYSEDEQLSKFLREAASNMSLLRSAEAVDVITRAVGKTFVGFLMRDELDFDAPLERG